ncbi:amphi-Trp domain-containing protein [Desulfovibrio sulfodismutans]|jgi:amphi-Trp domain-containing protein|uniref:Amphi-Trp domain-containing protein n=1 Tax=Desulfolutivibrio sulfodismutans TaxID=63561 RepID=A0A7K3NIQ3_9BACT|nr:amphi-Trp domain-containing protein [Desulfolutivibrio sulfodismutans]NDY56076.1 amphi-Trp domain-containing protein [Desulfolutivibrio sulfodismutans]QLA12331.1 amphi-Trp domain-containing protein [Desulfolutivibrio sulfodismutans DSM 3696]
MSQKGKFSYESLQDSQILLTYLKALVQGFESGTMRFSVKDDEIELHPTGLIHFGVEAKAKRDRMKLILKFAWREGEDDPRAGHDVLRVEAEKP